MSTKRPLLALTIAMSLLVALPSRADDPVLDLLVGRFGNYVESLRTQAGIPGLAVAIVSNTNTVWARAFGKQDLEHSIATRTDTPFHLDGLTQVFTATLVLRCVEEGRLSLTDPIGQYASNSPEPGATLGQLLSHTSGPPDSLVFAYRPGRLAPLTSAVEACTGVSFRETLANQLDRLAMVDSVPGPDVIHLMPSADGFPDSSAVARYTSVLARMAAPYAVDHSLSHYSPTTLTPASGLISTVLDVAQFILALRKGVLLQADTLALAWHAPLGRDGQRLPHGLGWFVQSYNGETIVWQFGVGVNGSSSLEVIVPGRGLSLLMFANSTGLVKPFPLAAGDLTTSPFGRLFLGLFVAS
jgi:CubicO group peptidase (beta-lactamase class C family)